jgi:hypothetical protein
VNTVIPRLDRGDASEKPVGEVDRVRVEELAECAAETDGTDAPGEVRVTMESVRP